MLALLCSLTACAPKTPKVPAEPIDVIQQFTLCGRPVPPVYTPWTLDVPEVFRGWELCAPVNIEATARNWSLAQVYIGLLEDALDCYKRQASAWPSALEDVVDGRNATGGRSAEGLGAGANPAQTREEAGR